MEHSTARPDAEFDHFPAAFGGIGIRVQRTDGGGHGSVTGKLLNLSLRGAKLSLESAIPAQHAITLRFQNSNLNSELSTGGKVKRIQPGGDGSWIVGCIFTEPLPRLALRNLFHGDVAEKRKAVRYRVVGEAVIDWESGRQGVVVRLEDISTGGFQMLAEDSATIGARVTLVLRTSDRRRFSIPAVARWQLETPEGYNIGCQFLYDQGPYLLQAILPKAASERPLNLSLILRRLVSWPKGRTRG